MTRSTLRWLFGALGISMGLFLPFVLPLLDERGLEVAQIGLVLGVSGLVSLLAYPLWGVLADGWLGRRRTIVAAATTAAVGGAWVAIAGSEAVALTLAISLALAGVMSLGPLIDALTLDALGDESTEYGQSRAWTSLAWAGAAISAGLLWTAYGSTPVLLAFTASVLAIPAIVVVSSAAKGTVVAAAATPAAAVTDAPGVPEAGVVVPEADVAVADVAVAVVAVADVAVADVAVAGVGGRWPSLRSSLVLLGSPVVLGFLAALLLVSIGEHSAWRYAGLRILDQGGGVFLVGLAVAIPALVEIPFFASSRRLASRLGLRMIFVAGALIAAVVAALIAFATEAWLVTLLRSIDGSSFALRYLGMVLVIGAMLPRSLHAIGQSLGWLMMAGIAPIVADLGGGLIYASLGGNALFLVAAGVILLGAVIAYVVLSGSRFGRGGDRVLDPAS